MIKKLVAVLAALFFAAAAFAADANKASQAELEAIKGIGPTISARIIDERKKSEFKDWNDLVARVKGIGEKNAATFSEGGLTVNGKTYGGATPAAAPAKAATKPAAEASKETAAKTGSPTKGTEKTTKTAKGGAASAPGAASAAKK